MSDTRRPYHHGDLRNELLTAGVELLAEGGVDALSLREAARRAGVSHAAPYRHFADRQALLDAIATEGFAHLTTVMRAALDTAGSAFADRLRALAGAYVRFALERPAQFQLMFAAPKVDSDRNQALRETADAAFAVLLDVVADGQENGQVVAGDPAELSWITWSAVHGAATLIAGGHRDEAAGSVDEIVSACAATIWDGLRPR